LDTVAGSEVIVALNGVETGESVAVSASHLIPNGAAVAGVVERSPRLWGSRLSTVVLQGIVPVGEDLGSWRILWGGLRI